jgi:type I restriction enzyme R subunit
MRPVNSMIEFKQIIGRGTRLFDGKDYFTILDFVKAYQHFSDPEWDGEPLEPDPPRQPTGGKPGGNPPEPPDPAPDPEQPKAKLVIRLADGKDRAFQHIRRRGQSLT